MAMRYSFNDEPCFVISIAARMVGVHAQTLRYYERVGLIDPSRTMGRRRVYSPQEIERLRRIKALTEGMGVNLAGVEVVLKLMDRIGTMETTIKRLTEQVNQLQTTQSQKRQPLPQQEA